MKKDTPPPPARISPNSVAIAGEFAVLSRLALRGYDANMTLGHTKNVDILVSDPRTNRFYQLEVKSALVKEKPPAKSRLFGRYHYGWIMHKKHETIMRPELWYCFVLITLEGRTRFFLVPSGLVADYVRLEHRLWLDESSSHKDTLMRVFRIGIAGERYLVPTPTAERYEDNWDFRGNGDRP